MRTVIAATAGSALEVAIRAIGYNSAPCPPTPAATSAAVDRQQPHVIFLDGGAPEAGAVLAKVIAEPVHPPIIVVERPLTLGAPSGDHWLAAGADDHLTTDQLTPTIVRRVVYWQEAGTRVEKGQRLGMMKFGSRMDLYFPAADVEATVRRGDKVRAGETVVARLKKAGA